MGITVAWDNPEQTVIRVTFSGEFTLDEYDAMDREVAEMLDSVGYEVDFIADLERVVIPKGISAHFRKLASASPYTHPGAGLMVMVGASGFAKLMLDIFSRMNVPLAEKIEVAASPEEAREIITEHRRARSNAA